LPVTQWGDGQRYHISVQHPQRINICILESSTPGIEDFLLKKQRVEFDFLLADKIKESVQNHSSIYGLILPYLNL
jgi:hypothetical protein